VNAPSHATSSAERRRGRSIVAAGRGGTHDRTARALLTHVNAHRQR
jgi:tripartite-type tricarboxylate transporter receptor subunit TctC